MHLLRWVALGLFALGLALLAVAVARGEAVLYLVLIFPVIQATGPMAFGGVAALIAGILLFFTSFALAPLNFPVSVGRSPAAEPPGADVTKEVPERRSRAGGVLFLGPIPIVFGSDPQVARWMIVVAVVLFLLLLAFWILVAAF